MSNINFLKQHFTPLNLEEKYNHVENLQNGSIRNSTLIIGKRETGKLTLTKKIINSYNVDSIVIFTNDVNRYSEFTNAKCFIEFDSKIMSDILIKQQNITESKPVLIIFDQCFHSVDINKNEYINIFSNHAKSYKIRTIFILQFPIGIDPALRNMFDLVFVFGDNYIANIKKIYNQYFQCLPQFEIFNTLIKDLENYASLVLDTRNFRDITKKISYYKTN